MKTTYAVTLESVDQPHRFPSPPYKRLALALKLLLRSFGLRCVGLRQEPQEPLVMDCASREPGAKAGAAGQRDGALTKEEGINHE